MSGTVRHTKIDLPADAHPVAYRVAIAYGSREFFYGLTVAVEKDTIVELARRTSARLLSQWNTAAINRQRRGPKPVVKVYQLIEVIE